MESQHEKGAISQVYLFHNRPRSGVNYTPVSQQLLPLDETWRHKLTEHPWPTGKILREMVNIFTHQPN